jgi:DNA-directed RNA polymerase subunit RPC12/RpoP
MNENDMILYRCTDCNVLFGLWPTKIRKINCPICADFVAVNKLKKPAKAKPFKIWTLEEEQILIQMINSYYNKEIADRLGRSERSVSRKLEELRKKGVITEYRRMGVRR